MSIFHPVPNMLGYYAAWILLSSNLHYQVVAVVLENYEGPEDKPDCLNNDNQDTENDQDRQECAGVNQANASSEALSRATSWKNIVTDRGLSVTL